MEKKPLKVAMICHISNQNVIKKLKLKIGFFEFIVRKIKGLSTDPYKCVFEIGLPISNALNEYEKNLDGMDLHVISPCSHLLNSMQSFDISGVHYNFFSDENGSFWNRIMRRIHMPNLVSYKKNKKCIIDHVKCINPDIVYVIGLENTYYSSAVINLNKNIPIVAQLSTLLSDPNFEKNYPIDHKTYMVQKNYEQEILKRVDFIGTSVDKIKNIIVRDVKRDAVFLNTKLAIGEQINKEPCEKKYDFVYYAANINKAFDLALEAFSIASKKNNLTLLVVGGFSVEYKKKIDSQIESLELQSKITFTGRLPTHDDVIKKIREARFGLIPLKIDIVSCTIRECMANGIPVVTTITDGGTPVLNNSYETVLLSAIGDHENLAKNMLRLFNDPVLAERLRQNGYRKITECYSNAVIVQQQKKALFAAYENFKNNIPLPQEIIS